MGFHLTSPAPEKGDPTAEKCVWEFFGDAQQSHRKNRAQSLQPRQENPLTTTKTASGRTYWPSRDPIGANFTTGEFNPYVMVKNRPITNFDILGLYIDDSGNEQVGSPEPHPEPDRGDWGAGNQGNIDRNERPEADKRLR